MRLPELNPLKTPMNVLMFIALVLVGLVRPHEDEERSTLPPEEKKSVFEASAAGPLFTSANPRKTLEREAATQLPGFDLFYLPALQPNVAPLRQEVALVFAPLLSFGCPASGLAGGRAPPQLV